MRMKINADHSKRTGRAQHQGRSDLADEKTLRLELPSARAPGLIGMRKVLNQLRAAIGNNALQRRGGFAIFEEPIALHQPGGGGVRHELAIAHGVRAVHYSKV